MCKDEHDIGSVKLAGHLLNFQYQLLKSGHFDTHSFANTLLIIHVYETFYMINRAFVTTNLLLVPIESL